MSAGQYPAGAGQYAGADPAFLVVPAATDGTGVATTAVAACFYDPLRKVYVQNPDGTMQGVDPTDQAMAIVLTVPANSIPSAPTVGYDLDVMSAGDPALATKADAALRLAADYYVQAGRVDIAATQGAADPNAPGRIDLATDYENLTTKQVQTL